MTGVIDRRIVEGDEVGPLRGRQTQPGDDLLDPLVVREMVVELEVVGWPHSGNFRLGAGPEEARTAHALLLRQHPQRRAPVPASIGSSGGVVIGIALLARRVVEAVGHDAVMLGIKPGDQRVVVGKGQRRVGRDHPLSGDGPLCTQREEMFGAVLLGIVVAETVQRNHHYIRFCLLRLGVRSVIDRDHALRG